MLFDLENIWKIFNFKDFRRSSNVRWYQRPSELPWMIFDLEYLPNVLMDIWSWLSKDPRTIFDLEEFPQIFELSLTSKNFPKVLNDLRSWRNVGSSLNDLWSRRSSDYLWMKFDLEDFSKTLEWPSISKFYRRLLIDIWSRRSSEDPWMIFDLNSLKILERYLISKSFRKSLYYLWPKKFSQDPWMIVDHEERRSSLNELWLGRSFDQLSMKFDLEDLSQDLEWSSISTIFRRSLNDLSSKSIGFQSHLIFFSQSQFLKKIEFDWHAIFQNYTKYTNCYVKCCDNVVRLSAVR